MQAALDALRDGNWLTRERIRLVAAACLALTLIALAAIALTAKGLNDYQGRPVGTDFASFYAAGASVLAGEPDAAFDPLRQFAREKAIFGPGGSSTSISARRLAARKSRLSITDAVRLRWLTRDPVRCDQGEPVAKR